ncbi:flagellin domain protein [Thermodesulfobacterium geofontis OPF15]|uniref:Flagellin n=1 Tax=Thermodesulfobacterium geofontis (strain OPF15) TaxID=795359 RepID=F8C2M9_THEGP|nr:flagellin [Thermodesulfobacterium geofontis]AEH23426.1 flagellin domain protein [Thermodesulfobacterium geofontis OPF15]
MAVKINFNAEAAKTHTALIQNERAMGKSLLRLSTGYKILNAADDSAGLFIADMLGTVAAALDQGNANIQTGISALQIAESSAGQIYTKLQEIYVRAQRAANDINDPNARAALQQEINNFIDAIQKIGTDTEYNGIKLLDGTFTEKYIHYGPRADQVVSVSISNLKASNIGAYVVQGTGKVKSDTTAYTSLITGNWQYNSSTDTVTVAGVNLNSSIYLSYTGAVDAKAIADAINNNATLQQVGISARATNISIASTEWSNIQSTTGSVTMRFYVGKSTNSADAIEITVAQGETLTLDQLISQINTQASAKGLNITASSSGNKLVLQTTGETIGVEVIRSDTNAASVDLGMLLQGATASASGSSTTASAVKVGNLTIAGTDSYNYNFTGISATNEGLGVANIGNGSFYNLYSIDVTTNSGAELAMDIVNTAIKKVDKVRAQIGAVMNNLQSIFDSQKVAYDNTKEAESVIRNTDYAKEMAEFVTYQIRMQATVAMLAQANTLPQLVLQLMR